MDRAEQGKRNRSEAAIVQAFVSLLAERRFASIRLADVASRAGVGRATLYRHFPGKQALLARSMEPLLAALAGGSTAPASHGPQLHRMVEHLWSNRRLARIWATEGMIERLRRDYAALIRERLDALRTARNPRPSEHRAIQIAAAQLAFIEAWLRGEITATPDEAVQAIVAAASI